MVQALPGEVGAEERDQQDPVRNRTYRCGLSLRGRFKSPWKAAHKRRPARPKRVRREPWRGWHQPIARGRFVEALRSEVCQRLWLGPEQPGRGGLAVRGSNHLVSGLVRAWQNEPQEHQHRFGKTVPISATPTSSHADAFASRFDSMIQVWSGCVTTACPDRYVRARAPVRTHPPNATDRLSGTRRRTSNE